MSIFPQFATVVVRRKLSVSARVAWARIGNFADAGRFLGIESRVTEGDGNLGSVREVGDTVVEVMVGQTRTSYTYAQIEGPMATLCYHGCVAVEADGPDACELTWTLTFDQTLFSNEQRAAEHERLTQRFEGGVSAMKTLVEAS
ncbi:hypothetical protein ABIE56_000303 [Luteibacter sp. 621]|uniref:SRPBCC family protein n=1 Tax=Luteibacter sp. 621 TaxID=3373916 RepID=UPI003D23BA63